MTAMFPPPAIRTACPYCGVGCGVKATPDGLGGAAITGDETHPANFGRLCSKGSALGETLSLEGRLLHPMRKTAGGYQRISWDDALDLFAERLAAVSKAHGPQAIAFYLSGQLLTEDYYVANKLAKGFIGTPHVDTNSRLCMASSVAGHRRAFGADLVPGNYGDLDEADLIVLVGSNAAWCHPVLFQRMQTNRRGRGAKIIVIDPRKNATAEDADLFLSIRPGTDSVLFAALLVAIEERGLADRAFIERSTGGYAEALAAARALAPNLETVAAQTDLSVSHLQRFIDLWITTEKTVTAWSQGVNQSAIGTDKVNAIINCHLATRRIGRPGIGPFSLTGQPNAMGGREVGGLANMLAAHMSYAAADRDRVRRFWNAPHLAEGEGHKAVAMFDAIEKHEIRVLWVMATNPAVSMPDAGRVQRALRGLDFFVVSDVVLNTGTIAQEPDLLLPAAAWGEKDGMVTNSERRMSRQRPFLPPAGEALPDWRIASELGKRLGFGEAFAFASPAAVFREHAALSAFENDGARVFDIGALAGMSDAAYDAFVPAQWPMRKGVETASERLFADGRFATPDGRARFIPVALPAIPAAAGDIRLNTGRMRDHWHTMTRTGKSARLSQHAVEPMLVVHPDDAARLGLAAQGFAAVRNAQGEAILRVSVDPAQRKSEAFLPIHWSAANASSGIGPLVHRLADPVSGQPDLKGATATLAPVSFAWQGFLIARDEIAPDAPVWARRIIAGGYATLFATDDTRWIDALDFSIRLEDHARGAVRCISLVDGRIERILFLTRGAPHSELEALLSLFAEEKPRADGRAILFGRVTAPSDGQVVCSCFGVKRKPIERFISASPDATVSDVGERLKAGTNCGSCLPELRAMLRNVTAVVDIESATGTS